MRADTREAILQQHIKMAESSLKDHEVLRLSHVAVPDGRVMWAWSILRKARELLGTDQ